jgi:CelD/BcsL family acetyltransferase involved in cellulose biosynthesis
LIQSAVKDGEAKMLRLSLDEFKSPKIEAIWKQILRNSRHYDIGHTYEWNRYWWETYSNFGLVEKDPFILADGNHGMIAAIWPFFIRRRYGMRIVHWVGQSDGMTTDYMGVVAAEEMNDKTVRNLLEFLADNTRLWDIVDLRIPAWTNLIAAFIKNLVVCRSVFDFEWETRISDYAVVVNLYDHFEKNLSAMGKRTRGDIRQYLRAAGQNQIRFEIYRKNVISSQLRALFDLSTNNWMIFNDEGSRRFIVQVVESLATSEEHIILGVLAHKAKAIASVLGFERDGTCYLHPAGVLRHQVAGVSPGITMYAMLINSLIERKFKRLDLSPGLEEYKFRLGGHAEPVYQFLIWHHKSKINQWRLFDWMGKTISNPIYYFTRKIRQLRTARVERT